MRRFWLSYFTSERLCDILWQARCPKHWDFPVGRTSQKCNLRHTSYYKVDSISSIDRYTRFFGKRCYKSNASYEYHYKRSIFVVAVLLAARCKCYFGRSRLPPPHHYSTVLEICDFFGRFSSVGTPSLFISVYNLTFSVEMWGENKKKKCIITRGFIIFCLSASLVVILEFL